MNRQPLNIKTSILICTYNRGDLINGTLKALIVDQSVKPDQIVVVNGGGENNCLDILIKWRKVFKELIIVDTINKNLSHSRNIGLVKCVHSLILLTDDDARPYPNWVENIIFYHQKYPNAGNIGGGVFDNNSVTFLSKVADIVTFPRYKEEKRVKTIPGVNSSFKRAAILEVGEYDTLLFRGEDVDYNWRVLKKGWDIIYVPSIKVKHVHRTSWMKLFYQHYMYGRAYYILRRKWKTMYSIYPIKIESYRDIIKYIASWTYTPFMDAVLKSKFFEIKNPLIILIIYFVNLCNRIGIFVQKNLYE